MHASAESSATRIEETRARRWFLLSIGSLLLSGLLSICLLIARTPPFDRLVSDPLFFKRALVVHVDLALLVWIWAFAAALFSCLPAKGRKSPLAGIAPYLGAFGVLLLIIAAGIPGARPVLANYVPIIGSPVFVAGLVSIALGVTLALLDVQLLPSREQAEGFVALPAPARPGLRAMALCFLAALITFAASHLATPNHLSLEAYAEVVAWGGGHVLQFASVAAMVTAWILLLTAALGRAPISRGLAALLFGVLALPALGAPLLALASANAPITAAYRSGFTQLMRWAIFPVISVFLILFIRQVVIARREGRLPRLTNGPLLGFLASAGLTVLGFVLGAFIRGSNTLVPAHYHAAIGGVTAAFMATAFLLAAPLGLPLRTARARRLGDLAPAIFGTGQAVFAIGFGFAGVHGMGRKLYGAEQAARGPLETLGLGVMGLGGLTAVVGGLLFLTLIASAALHARTRPAERNLEGRRSPAWDPKTESIPSRS